MSVSDDTDEHDLAESLHPCRVERVQPEGFVINSKRTQVLFRVSNSDDQTSIPESPSIRRQCRYESNIQGRCWLDDE